MGGRQDKKTGRSAWERLAAPAYRLLCAALFSTYRMEWSGPGVAEIDRRVAAGEPFVAAFWHYGVLLWPWLCGQRGGDRWAAMVSASQDGGLIAAILESQGVRAVRGSRNRLSTQAMKHFIRYMRQGYRAAIVADGSQGPARRAQAGAVVLAAHGRCPLVPMNWAADRFWRFASWDHTVLPKPFSRVVVSCGAPLAVPLRPDRRTLEQQRLALEQGLDFCYAKAWGMFGRKGHEPEPSPGQDGGGQERRSWGKEEDI